MSYHDGTHEHEHSPNHRAPSRVIQEPRQHGSSCVQYSCCTAGKEEVAVLAAFTLLHTTFSLLPVVA